MRLRAAIWFLILILSSGAIAGSEANSAELSEELILKPLALNVLIPQALVPEAIAPDAPAPELLSQEAPNQEVPSQEAPSQEVSSQEVSSQERVIPETLTSQTSRFFVLANLEFTLLHEFSHMLIEELKLPVLGTEEDAADRIAIMVMLKSRQHQSAEEVIPWLFAVAGDWYTEWELRDRPSGKIDYWDNHGLEIQRFHNIVCLIYGAKVELLEDLIDTEILPFERAMGCEAEYQQADHAVQWIRDTYGHSGKIMNAGEQFTVTYEEPIEGQNTVMFDLLQNSRVAEKIAAALSARFSLPRPISIEFDNCVSEPDAYWHTPTASVTVCYELLGHFLKMAEYRQKNSRRACDIPSLRKYMGARLRCEDSDESGPSTDSEGKVKKRLKLSLK